MLHETHTSVCKLRMVSRSCVVCVKYGVCNLDDDDDDGDDGAGDDSVLTLAHFPEIDRTRGHEATNKASLSMEENKQIKKNQRVCGEFGWVRFLVVCFLCKTNPNPRKCIYRGKKWPNCHL